MEKQRKKEVRKSSFLLDLIFPWICPFCGIILKKGEFLCTDCRKTLAWTFQDQETVWRNRKGCLCFAPLWYRDGTKEAVKSYKFKNHPEHATTFGMLMSKCIANPEVYDLITWVPLDKKRYRRRGYNQAKLLAEEVATRLHLPLSALLVKTKENKVQSSIEDEQERTENVEGAYCLLPDIQNLENLNIILVDDVMTTGSTAHACEKLMMEAGAKSVHCLVLARAKR